MSSFGSHDKIYIPQLSNVPFWILAFPSSFFHLFLNLSGSILKWFASFPLKPLFPLVSYRLPIYLRLCRDLAYSMKFHWLSDSRSAPVVFWPLISADPLSENDLLHVFNFWFPVTWSIKFMEQTSLLVW